MSRRTRNILIVALLLLLIGAIVAYLLLRPGAAPATTMLPEEIAASISKQLGGSGNKTAGANVNAAAVKPVEEPVKPAEPVKPDTGAALKRLAMAFAERFGSFSNQSGFQNILDLRSFMTPFMVTWADDYVADAQAKGQMNPEYFGIVTRALSAEVVKLDETLGIAKIAVTTQRRETASNGDEKIYYQVLDIDFIMTDGAWKVNAAKWGDKADSG